MIEKRRKASKAKTRELSKLREWNEREKQEMRKQETRDKREETRNQKHRKQGLKKPEMFAKA